MLLARARATLSKTRRARAEPAGREDCTRAQSTSLEMNATDESEKRARQARAQVRGPHGKTGWTSRATSSPPTRSSPDGDQGKGSGRACTGEAPESARRVGGGRRRSATRISGGAAPPRRAERARRAEPTQRVGRGSSRSPALATHVAGSGDQEQIRPRDPRTLSSALCYERGQEPGRGQQRRGDAPAGVDTTRR